MIERVDDDCDEAFDDLRSTLDAGGVVGLWDWDMVRRTARYDRGAADLLALDPELAGQPLHGEAAMAGIHPDDRDWLRSELQRALQGGVFLAEYRVITADRGSRWLLSRGRVYEDQRGRPVRSKGILIDITENRDESEGFITRMEARNQHPLDKVAAHLLDARNAIDAPGSEAPSHLRTAVDLALFEVGAYLARRSRH